MPVTSLSAAARDLLVGQVWPLAVLVLDADLDLAAVTPTLVVTLPDGALAVALPAYESDAAGTYRFAYPVTTPGRHLAVVTAGDYGSATFVMWARLPTPTSDLPTVVDVDDYLRSGSGDHSWTTDQLQQALDAEAAAQARVCRIRAYYPPDLREALLRRVQRNLALRSNALAMFRGDAETGDPQAFLPGTDPEVRRLERPHRKIITG